MVQMINLLPINAESNLIAGEYMTKINQHEFARQFLTNAINWSHSKRVTQRAQALMMKLPESTEALGQAN